jgi:hypothetical protein
LDDATKEAGGEINFNSTINQLECDKKASGYAARNHQLNYYSVESIQ